MDINEVPQDALEYKDRDKLKKLLYAVDKDGKYTGVGSSGWEAENTATRQAWEAIEEEMKETEMKIKNGELSPIVYFMQKKLMDISILSKYVGKWQWQVKRHFKPAVFNRLSDKMLEKYAAVFDITKTELINFSKDKLLSE